MAYEVVMPYHLHMPSYFLETFTEYPYEIYFENFILSNELPRHLEYGNTPFHIAVAGIIFQEKKFLTPSLLLENFDTFLKISDFIFYFFRYPIAAFKFLYI